MREFEMLYPVLKKMSVLIGSCLWILAPLCAEEMPPKEMKRERFSGKSRGQSHGMRRNAVFWRVFSQLSEPERKKMQELQRNDPEQFTVEMRKLAEKYEKQALAWRSKLTSLIEKYRKSTDRNEKAGLKAEITAMEKERFEKHISGLTKTIEGAKRRVAMMEVELKKRRAKADAIVNARVEALIKGEIPVMPPRRPGPPRKPGPPRRILP